MLSSRALESAVDLARRHGISCDHPQILKDGANLLVHLAPAPVVARVATTTALVRQPIEHWLERDLAMARALHAAGMPVVPPSRELPAGPHHHGGFSITFWQHVAHDRNYLPTADETAGMLRDLHASLRTHAAGLDLPWLGPLTEIFAWIDWLERGTLLAPDDIALLRRSHADLVTQTRAAALPEQALHGDAHKGNLLKTPHGLLWTDFEDACFGPIAWDVACFAATTPGGAEAALRAYGDSIDAATLATFSAARQFEAVVWYQVLVTRFPGRRQKADEILRQWRARH
jgi:aminoglycoside phosphotransferase (APT) family kinase protein